MKRILVSFGFMLLVLCGQATGKANIDSSRACFYSVFNSLKDMLEGKDSLNYERAVFITENAYYDNKYNYNDFKQVLDFQTRLIERISESARQEHQEEYSGMKQYERKMFLLNTDNWAIFKYITDTTFFNSNGNAFFRKPFLYSTQDPYGTSDWRNTQVIHLLSDSNQQGNCYPLAVLFKIFSDRLKSDARLTVAPHHIYIQNRNAKGDFCNVELATKSFPGDGTIQTLTYTTNQSIMNGMAQRMLSNKECVTMNLIYLAKGFEHRFNDNTDDFLINCAILALKYDSLSLNALMLKAEVTENRLFEAMRRNNITTVQQARSNIKTETLFLEYEKQLNNLYKSGYREIPKDIEQMIIAGIQKRDEVHLLADNTPNPFVEIGTKQRYATLSWGLFDELHEHVDTIQYSRALLNTKTKGIIEFIPNDSKSNYSVDPVVFAMSIDPLTSTYPELTPYQFASNRPIDGLDMDGLEYATFTIFIQNGKVTDITVTTDYELKNKNTLGPGVQLNYAYLDAKGKLVKFEAKPLVTNLYGIYQGSDNPKLPDIGGDPNKLHDDYSLPPIDETDAAAKQHDIDYDKAGKLEGVSGILDARSTPANEKYSKSATKIIQKQKTGGVDVVTGKPVTKNAAEAAKFGRKWFQFAENLKRDKNAEKSKDEKLLDSGPKY